MKKNKMLAIVLILNLIITTALNLYPSKVFAASQTISNEISKIDDKKYPGIKSMIQTLQKQHPDWNFKVLYTGLDWNDVITQESKHGRNLIGKSYSKEWVCEICGYKGYSGTNWVCASSTAISYMMDPRNSLKYTDIFQFLELSYDKNAKYDTNIINNILSGSFLDDGKLDTYINTIMSRCKEKNVNPYYIAGKIIQEQGKKGGATAKMQITEDDKTKYYYNIFNINASGTTTSAIVSNALSRAKSKGWDTIEKCLIGGVDFIANGYITIGQDTMYFEKYDVIADTYYTHQYAQDIFYAQNQGEKLRKILEDIKATEYAYTFVIPLYENMPAKACGRPTQSSITNTNSNTDNTAADNTTTVVYKLGDPNNDGKINSGDLLMIKQYLLKVKEFKDENQLLAMDINKDGKINSGDLLLVKRHLLGTYKITQ